jgi:hypothetical protein
VSVGIHGGLRGGKVEAGEPGWETERGTLSQLWASKSEEWTASRSEQLFEGIMDKLETRRRRRRFMRMAITCAGVAVTLMMGLRLAGFGIDGPLAHLFNHV